MKKRPKDIVDVAGQRLRGEHGGDVDHAHVRADPYGRWVRAVQQSPVHRSGVSVLQAGIVDSGQCPTLPSGPPSEEHTGRSRQRGPLPDRRLGECALSPSGRASRRRSSLRAKLPYVGTSFGLNSDMDKWYVFPLFLGRH